jgi:hypothetical protein
MSTLSDLPFPVRVALRVWIPHELAESMVEAHVRAAVRAELEEVLDAIREWGLDPGLDHLLVPCPRCGVLVQQGSVPHVPRRWWQETPLCSHCVTLPPSDDDEAGAAYVADAP